MKLGYVGIAANRPNERINILEHNGVDPSMHAPMSTSIEQILRQRAQRS